MAQVVITKDNQRAYLGHWANENQFTVQAYKYHHRGSDFCIKAAELLRTTGVDARAVQESGEPLESQSRTPTAPTTDTRPTSFRGVEPKRGNDGRFYITWQDSLVGTCSVSGASPQECLDKLFNSMSGDARVQRFVATLPPEETPAEPIPQATAPTPPSDGRILRHADLNRASVLPERRAETPRVDPNLAFAAWEATASISQIKQRCRSDAAFNAWYSQTNARLVEEGSKKVRY